MFDVRRSRRAGVSLLEVMFAIGIIMIGLLGVAVLIPVAGRMASDAQMIDRAARVGLNSVAEVELAGMVQPRRWVHLTDGFNNDGDMQMDEYDEIRVGGVIPAVSGFCLDPRFTAANGWTINAQADSRFFPYVAVDMSNDPAAVRMRRITLAPGFGIDGADNDGDGNVDEPDEFNLGIPLAEETFVSQDDLVVDLPQDPLIPAQQTYGDLQDKRQFEGRVSWFATITPHGTDTSLYILSIVVLQNRDTAMPMNGVTERVAWIPHQVSGGTITQTGFFGGGISGGDVAITHRSSSSTPPGTPDDLTVRRGEWVMLARMSGAAPQVPLFRWYKVIEADGELGDSGEFAGSSPTAGQPIRHLTLFGPDWTPDPNNQTLVYLMPGVLTVYEKTIRLENSSLWVP